MKFLGRRRSGGEIRSAVSASVMHLGQTLRTGERAIGVLSRQFQLLAEDCDHLLQATQVLVEAMESSCAGEVLPFMRRIYAAAERVLQMRLEATGGIASLMEREREMLGELARPARAQESTSRTARILAVMLRIEIARLGEDGSGFSYMAGELDQASQTISQGVQALNEMIEARRESAPERQRVVEEAHSHANRNLAMIEERRDEALRCVDASLQDLNQLPRTFDDCVRQVSSHLSRVTSAVQMQDLTRQQTEHAMAALQSLATAEGSAGSPARSLALLEVQQEQIANVRETMRAWIEEIEECVQSILQLGDVQLLAILEKILELQQSLETQGRWVQAFGVEFAAHDRVNEQQLSDFEGVMQMVRRHLEQSQTTSEHLQLLNLNSMVAAHNVGNQAASVLQITNSISRLAADWREMTKGSVASMETMLETAASRGVQAREAASSTRSSIEAIEAESEQTLSALRKLSEQGEACRERGQKVVRLMHGRAAQVRQSSKELRTVLEGLEAAAEAVAAAIRECGSAKADSLAEPERRLLAESLEQSYTSEAERTVLRRVLLGEHTVCVAPPLQTGAIELF